MARSKAGADVNDSNACCARQFESFRYERKVWRSYFFFETVHQAGLKIKND
jgi:hypothetical protein